MSLVQTGQLTPYEGGGGGGRRTRGTVYVDKAPLAFFVAGSNVEAANGIYALSQSHRVFNAAARAARDRAEAPELSFAYAHDETGWTLGLVRDTDAEESDDRTIHFTDGCWSWVIIDKEGNDRFVQRATSIIPSGLKWSLAEDGSSDDDDESSEEEDPYSFGFFLPGYRNRQPKKKTPKTGGPVLKTEKKKDKQPTSAADAVPEDYQDDIDVSADATSALATRSKGENPADALPCQVIALLDADILRDLRGAARYRKYKCERAAKGLDGPSVPKHSVEGCWAPGAWLYKVAAPGGVTVRTAPSHTAPAVGKRRRGEYLMAVELKCVKRGSDGQEEARESEAAAAAAASAPMETEGEVRCGDSDSDETDDEEQPIVAPSAAPPAAVAAAAAATAAAAGDGEMKGGDDVAAGAEDTEMKSGEAKAGDDDVAGSPSRAPAGPSEGDATKAAASPKRQPLKPKVPADHVRWLRLPGGGSADEQAALDLSQYGIGAHPDAAGLHQLQQLLYGGLGGFGAVGGFGARPQQKIKSLWVCVDEMDGGKQKTALEPVDAAHAPVPKMSWGIDDPTSEVFDKPFVPRITTEATDEPTVPPPPDVIEATVAAVRSVKNANGAAARVASVDPLAPPYEILAGGLLGARNRMTYLASLNEESIETVRRAQAAMRTAIKEEDRKAIASRGDEDPKVAATLLRCGLARSLMETAQDEQAMQIIEEAPPGPGGVAPLVLSLLRARLLLRVGKRDEGFEQLQELCTRFPADDQATTEERLATAGPCAVWALKHVRALHAAAEVIKEHKSIADNRYLRGDFPGAVSGYNAALLASTGHLADDKVGRATLLANRAACHRRTRDHASALCDCDAALALLPRYGRAMLRRAVVLLEANRPKEGLRALEHLLRVDRTWPNLCDWLVRASAALRRAKERAKARGMMEDDEDSDAYDDDEMDDEDAEDDDADAPIELPAEAPSDAPPNPAVDDGFLDADHFAKCPDHYAVLGVTHDVDEAVLKRAYRLRSLKYHPDRAGGSTVAFQRVQLAFDILSDPVKRRDYNEGTDMRRKKGDDSDDDESAKPSFREEIERKYFPERFAFHPFGDPFVEKRKKEERERKEKEQRERMRKQYQGGGGRNPPGFGGFGGFGF